MISVARCTGRPQESADREAENVREGRVCRGECAVGTQWERGWERWPLRRMARQEDERREQQCAGICLGV